MKIAQKKELGCFVTRIMKDRRLSSRDVAENSGNKITAAYVNSIMNGHAANPSIDKIIALASGLGVGPTELFECACLESEPHESGLRELERLPWLAYLDLMRKVFSNAQLIKITERIVELSVEQQAVMLRYLDDVAEVDNDAHRKRQSV